MTGLVLFWPLLLASAQDQEWKPFVDQKAGFSVLLPGKPTVDKRQIKTSAGNLTVTLFVLEEKKTTFAVSLAVFPAKAVEADTLEQRLDKARDGAVATSGGTLKSEKKIALDQHPGRELHIENSSPGLVVTRMYVVKNRLYQVTITGPRQLLKDPATLKFLESFRLAR